MPAGHLNISFNEVRTLGQTLISRSNDLQSQLESIRVTAQPNGIWDSAAAISYQAEFERWSVAQRTMLDALREMGNFLERAATAYENTELDVQRALGLAS